MPFVIEKLEALKSFKPEIVDQMIALGYTQNFKKNSILSMHHQHTYLYFLEHGLIRIFTDFNGINQTLSLRTEGFLVPIQGLYQRYDQHEYIQFLEDSTLWSLNLSLAEQQLSQQAQYYKIILEIYEILLFEEKNKELLLRIVVAKERFETLKNDLKQIIYTVNNGILASYLRISLKHLIRIKSESK